MNIKKIHRKKSDSFQDLYPFRSDGEAFILGGGERVKHIKSFAIKLVLMLTARIIFYFYKTSGIS